MHSSERVSVPVHIANVHVFWQLWQTVVACVHLISAIRCPELHHPSAACCGSHRCTVEPMQVSHPLEGNIGDHVARQEHKILLDLTPWDESQRICAATPLWNGDQLDLCRVFWG